MTEPVQTPIVVNPSALPAQLAAGLRVATILVGGATAIIGFLGARDLVGLVAYIRSDDFVPVAGAAVAAASFAYGQWKTRRERAKLVTAAHAAPDSVAIVAPAKPAP